MGATVRLAGLPGPARLLALMTDVSSVWASVRLVPVRAPGLNVDVGFEAESTYESIDETTPLLLYSVSPFRYVLLAMRLAFGEGVADGGPPAVSHVLPHSRRCTATLLITCVKGPVATGVSWPYCVVKTTVKSCRASSS